MRETFRGHSQKALDTVYIREHGITKTRCNIAVKFVDADTKITQMIDMRICKPKRAKSYKGFIILHIDGFDIDKAFNASLKKSPIPIPYPLPHLLNTKDEEEAT